MSKIKELMGKSYNIIAYISIFTILILINFFHIFNDNFFTSIRSIALIVAGLIIILLLNKYIISKMNNKSMNILIVIFMIIFLILEILSIYYFKVEYNWDFKWLMDSAQDIATTGTTKNIYYFKIFPNNLGALIIITSAMTLFGGNEIGAYIANITFIFLAALFTVLSANKLMGKKGALNTIILLLCSAPIYLYAPIVYTDTLSVAFPVLTFYFWLVAKEQKGNKKHYISLALMAICGGTGFCIKPVAAIVFIAIIIDELFTNKKILKDLIISILIFALIIISFNKITEKYILKENRKNALEFPITHWVMMGLEKPESEGGTSIGYGAYSAEDADYTSLSGNYEEKKQANIQRIKERLKNFGIKGYIGFLFKKCRYVWNDGTYYVLKKIGWDTINTTSLPYQFIIGEKSSISNSFMKNSNNVLFCLIICTFIIETVRKKTKQETRILGISIVGIALFLLIWEARSRYIYFMIPVFCILGAMGIINILENIKYDKIKKFFNNKNNYRRDNQ